MASSSSSSLPENSSNEKTTIWVPKEAFASVQRFWKPEFNWIPVPVDRSLPPAQIAYIETNPGGGPISPLPPVPRMLPKTPRTPLTPLLPPLETSVSTRSAGGYFGGAAAGGFGDDDADGPRYLGENTERRVEGGDDDDAKRSPQELDTAVTQTRLSALLSSPGANSEDRPDTPSTATEPESPATPKDVLPPPVGGASLPPPSSFQQNGNGSRGGGLNNNTPPQPAIWRQSTDQPQLAQLQFPQEEDGESTISQQKKPPFNALHGLPASTQWRMVDRRSTYGPKDASLAPASWKTLDGPRDLRMTDHWQTRRRDEARWQERSEKGFAVRLDMHLNVEVELKGTVIGDITLSAEALYVSCISLPPKSVGAHILCMCVPMVCAWEELM